MYKRAFTNELVLCGMMMNCREVFTDDESLAIKLDPEIRWAYIAQHDEQLFAGQRRGSV